MSLVFRGEYDPYVNEGTFSNCLVGNPTGRLRFGSSTYSVAFQAVDETLLPLLGSQAGRIRGVGVLKKLFYFPQKVAIGEREMWVLINRRSAQKWLAREGDFAVFRVANTFLSHVGRSQIEEGLQEEEKAYIVPEVLQLIIKEGLSQREAALNTLQMLFPSSKRLIRTLNRSSNRFQLLKRVIAWGEFIRSFEDEDRRDPIEGLTTLFIHFSIQSLRKWCSTDEEPVNAFLFWLLAGRMPSVVKEKTKLTREEYIAFFEFIYRKRQELTWETGRYYYLFRPKETGLSRSVLFFRNGRVVIQFNRKCRGDGVVGKGAFSTVKTGLDVNEGKLIALSSTSEGKRGSRRERAYPAILKGYSAAAQIGEQVGVVSMWEGYEKQSKRGMSKCVVLMELVEGTQLKRFCGKMGVSRVRGRRWSLEFLEGLKHIHEKGVIHNDLKPSNVMVDTEGKLRIIDFGFAAKADAEGRGDPSINAGNHCYAAPQRLKGGPDSVHQKHDVWAAGAILWNLLSEDVQLYFKWTTYQEMWTQLVKMHSGNRIKMLTDVVERPSNWFLQDGVTLEKLQQSMHLSAQMVCLIAQMIQVDMDQRPTAAEAYARLSAILR